ncbi:MAG TPA: TolC family protein [Halanaerobiaceae bacterium]|jgi:outer membrane protein TolC|nr:TolC family protein [Bacillota bacterium]HHU93416.1 TolC family protein [Halanaerobiaceae bacterium]HOA41580.1 TolC family protein [Halanaerobiales bacterium]HQD04122.1 TolC family protein [Halanaerobiales bacterium]
MKKELLKKSLIIYLLLVFLLASGGSLFARELSLEEALAFALENNRNLRSAYEELQRQEKNLEDPVQLKWQVDLGANYSQDITGDKQPKPGNSSSNAYSINISADKSYLSGLRLSPGLNIKEGGDPSFSINITKSLYPLVPTDLARGIYKGELELIKARRNFAASKVSALLSWIETYFNLERMNSRLEIYQQNLQKAETNLERVLAREEIGDAGENDILLARLSLENARYSLQEAENNLENLRFNFLQELGFAPEEELVIRDNTSYLEGLRSKAEAHLEEFLAQDRSSLMELVKKNNARLEANLVEREILGQELDWLKKEGGPRVNLNSNYSSATDNLRVGLNLSYALYDGGQHKQAVEDKEKALAENLLNYEEIYRQLEQELKQKLDKLELAFMALRRGELNIARSQNELELAEKQLALGHINYLDYQEKWVAAAEARISLQSLEDDLFMTSLDFLNFLDQELLSELIGGVE